MGEQQEDELQNVEEPEQDKEGHSELFGETITELKHLKARSKTAFTKTRRTLLVLIQQKEVTSDAIHQACLALDMAQEEALETIEKLSDRYRTERDYKNSDRLGQEIDKIEMEYTDAQNRAQEVYDELCKSHAYSKFVKTLGESQPVRKNVTQQDEVSQPPGRVSQHDLVSNRSNLLASYKPSPVHQSDHDTDMGSTLIGQDMWKQLKRVTIPMFSGDKRNYQNWKAAFMACVDHAPATAEYKLLQLRQCLTGDALKVIESLGHSAAAYQAAIERLERKFGGQRRQVALYLEEIDNFRPIRPGSPKDIERFADLLDVAIVNLKEANRTEELRDGMLYMKLQKKLPASMLATYHRWLFENHRIECVEVLREWVVQEAEFHTRAMETVQGLSIPKCGKFDTRVVKESPRTFFGKSSFKSETVSGHKLCEVCGKSHGIWACEEFKKMEIPKRWEVSKKFKLCFRCLGRNHLGQYCTRTRVCNLDGCQEVHHRLLHQATKPVGISVGGAKCAKESDNRPQTIKLDQAITPVSKTATLVTEGETVLKSDDATMMSDMPVRTGNVALRTVSVYLRNHDRKLKVNALLDDASTKTYINADVAAELGLQGHPQRVNVSVLNGQVETFETTPVECVLESLNGKQFNITAFTTNRVTGNMKAIDWSTCAERWPHLKGIAFPKLGSRPIVDLLIGLDSSDLHYSFKDIKGKPGQPIARLTPLGWTCVGAIYQTEQCDTTTNFARTYFTSEQVTMEQVNTVLRQFWGIDNCGIEGLPVMTKEDKLILDRVEKSVKFVDGHYQVAIPWKESRVQMPNNYKMALQRLQSLEKRLLKCPETAAAYSEVIAKHLEKGYIRKVDPSELEPVSKWYLPHFAVVRSDRITTKIRVVFDASARCNDVSLNDTIHQGPKLQTDLFDVLLRFRRFPIAIACDISEMYLRIKLCPEDKAYHRFLWRNLDSSKSPCVYEFNRLVFGVNASPFLAQYVSQFHAKVFEQSHPRATETILKSTYMDDSIDSVVDEVEGVRLYTELSDLWKRAGMFTHKWLCNSSAVLKEIPLQDRAVELELDKNSSFTAKTLGLLWRASEDVFTFNFKIVEPEFQFTKRVFLRKIAMLYDPLGFLSPFTVRAKIIMQEMWIAGTGWDESLTDELCVKVRKWFNELRELQKIKVPRSLQKKGIVQSICLHTFVDASQDAYGAVVYLRIEYDDQTISVSLVAAKTRVAPLHSVSVPRLELMGAHLGCKLAQSVAKVLQVPLSHVIFWCDSTNVLWWLRGHSKTFRPFVANRVGEIQSVTSPEQWRYVPTELNVADHLTRGLHILELIDKNDWWKGPEYLEGQEEVWPKNKMSMFDHDVFSCAVEEVRKKYCERSQSQTMETQPLADTTMVITENSVTHQETNWRLNPERFSSWKRMIRVFSWVMRFVRNCRVNREHRIKEDLSLDELNDAEKQIIRSVQREVFHSDYVALQRKQPLSTNSKLLKLCPILDEDGLMRCNSRLQYAEFLPYNVRYPIILPRRSSLTKLIVRHYHEQGNHNAGTNQTLSMVSTKYWIVAAREAILEWERECAACRRRKVKCAKQIMAPLPLNRLESSLRAFVRTAVDIGGPFITVQGRGKQRKKRYLCLFTCLATRAVHLEVAYGLDTDSFLRAFNRMCNRRGVPEEMLSDNGTNFVGADQELRQLRNQVLQDGKLKESLINQGVKWIFNPPAAPHFGGVFETMIKAAKRAILAILGNADVNDEELTTAFTGAEALINSRPLTYQSASPEDDTPLTPNHFLHGQAGGKFAPGTDVETSYCPRKRWRRIQDLNSHFWRRWMKEWVPSLSARNKWYQQRKNLVVADVVLLVSPDSHRAHWPALGHILETYPSKDENVRSVKLQIQFVRSVVKLYPLELDYSS